MKRLIDISGIAGVLLLVMRLVGILIEFSNNNIFLIMGLGLLGFIFLPSVIIDICRQSKMTDKIIESYNNQESENLQISTRTTRIGGWAINNSSYGENKKSYFWENIKLSTEQFIRKYSKMIFKENLHT